MINLQMVSAFHAHIHMLHAENNTKTTTSHNIAGLCWVLASPVAAKCRRNRRNSFPVNREAQVLHRGATGLRPERDAVGREGVVLPSIHEVRARSQSMSTTGHKGDIGRRT